MSNKKDFEKWLNIKLNELNTDESVFGSYIMGILEGDETLEEKREGLEGILSAIIENNLDKVIEEILSAWEKCEPTIQLEPNVVEDVDTKFARLMETQQITTTVQRKYTEEELKIREQILAQYSQVEYEDEYEADNDDGAVASGSQEKKDQLLVKNTNAADVAALAKERREQAKIDSKAKKDKDKEDREKQKQLREEKKEKRKTVKGERRR